MSRVDERAVAIDAHEKPRDVLERLLRRGKANALEGTLAAGERLEALERQREVTASLVAGKRVDLVDDHGSDRSQNAASAVARQKDVERLRRRHQNVGWLAQHRSARLLRGVARAHEDADVGQRGVALAKLGERSLEVLLNVARESLERRNVEDVRFVGELGAARKKRVERGEERSERLARPGRSRNERVSSASDQRPTVALRRRRLAQPLGKPGLHGRMKRIEHH